MDKILDLDKSVASLVKEYPEVADIMADLLFYLPERVRTFFTILDRCVYYVSC